MTQEGAVPPNLKEQIQQMIDRSVAAAFRSAPLRNASISDGGITVKGGFIWLRAADGTSSLYMGGVVPALPDGTYQPGLILRREDGTVAMALYDPTPDPSTPGGFQQFLAVYDRAQQIVMSDDTASGQGLARPYIPIPVTRARYTDMVAVTDSAFVNVIETPGTFYKVNARARADIRCTTDTADTTGEVRVLVDGVQVGATETVDFAVTTKYIGPFAVPGDAYTQHSIKVQARRTAGTGAVRLDASVWGMQS